MSSTVLVMPTQYFFGADILVAPVTQPVDNITQMMEKKIWIPEVTVNLHKLTHNITPAAVCSIVFHSVHVLLTVTK